MKKINVLVISISGAVILFVILTVLQGKIVKRETTMIVYMANTDVSRDTAIEENAFKEVEVPAYLVADGGAVTNSKDLIGKYAKEPINKGQIIFKQDIAKKSELKIIEAEAGLERIAVKIKNAENAVAYQIKPQDRVHLYFTGKSNVIDSALEGYGISVKKNLPDNALKTEKIISDIEILGIYDEMGRGSDNSEFSGVDTIVIAVDSSKSELINNLRTQGTFDITR